MAIILVKRILEPEFLAKQTLCPLSSLHIPEIPAVHALGFDDEDGLPKVAGPGALLDTEPTHASRRNLLITRCWLNHR